MTPSPIVLIASLLQSIPEKVRFALLSAYAVAVVVTGALEVAGVDTGQTSEVLKYLGGYLAIQSAANVRRSDK